MAGHFHSIGLPMRTQEDFAQLINRVLPEGIPVTLPDSNFLYMRWAPGVGVELWLQQSSTGSLIGCNPHFSGSSRIQLAITDVFPSPEYPLDGAIHGWVNPAVDPDAPGQIQGDYPVRVDLPDFCSVADRIDVGRIVTLQIAAFAHDLEVFADEEAYVAAQERTPHLGAESFIPSGLFSPREDPDFRVRAEAIINGVVESAELRANPLTGVSFYAFSIRSYGATYDAVAVEGYGPIHAGNVVSGTFWLSGRVVQDAGEEAVPASEPAETTLFQRILDQVRASLGPAPRRFDDEKYLNELAIRSPAWMSANDELNQFIRNQRDLIVNGVVVWGHLVQANELMFRPGPNNHPGNVVYCTEFDRFVEPFVLEEIATRLFELKGKQASNAMEQAIGDNLAHERLRLYAQPVPSTISPDFPSVMTAILFDRRHLPDGFLQSGLFPLLVRHAEPQVAMVVPCKYWPIAR